LRFDARRPSPFNRSDDGPNNIIPLRPSRGTPQNASPTSSAQDEPAIVTCATAGHQEPSNPVPHLHGTPHKRYTTVFFSEVGLGETGIYWGAERRSQLLQGNLVPVRILNFVGPEKGGLGGTPEGGEFLHAVLHDPGRASRQTRRLVGLTLGEHSKLDDYSALPTSPSWPPLPTGP